MNHHVRIIFLAMIAVALTTISWTRNLPHGDPAAMVRRAAVRFGTLPPRVGIDQPVSLTTPLPESLAAVRQHLTVVPTVPVRIRERDPDHFLIMPRSLWPGKSRIALIYRGSAAHLQVATDDSREIEVDLSQQTLIARQDGRVVRTIPVSTGVAPRWSTPTGTFWIYRRVEDDHMVGGEPGTPNHWDVEHVPYAQYFTGAVAFHGAWWNHRFGRPISHGCVQLPTDESPAGPTGEPAEARWLWNFADIGTPVVVIGQTPDTTTTAKAPLPYPALDFPVPNGARSAASYTP